MSSKQLPIYQGAAHSLPQLSDGNAGLHFARFYDGYFSPDEDSAKSKFLQKFAKQLGNSNQLKEHAQRQMALAKAVQGDARIYSLDGHFVTGMGNAHPVENGFQWHYTLGLPYLAGSQVKGLVRSMIERYLDTTEHNKSELLLKWFGSTDKDSHKSGYQAQSGELIFFDALPYDKPKLTIDVMTPHMKDWYAKGDEIRSLAESDKIPADWHDPVPVPFLAVKEGKFVFSIGKRVYSDIDLKEVWEVLDKALAYLGAGGKTNTGFGYMTHDQSKSAELLEEQQQQQAKRAKAAEFAQAQASASPFHAELLRVAQQEEWQKGDDASKNKFTDALRNEWLEKLEANPEEQQSIEYIIDLANKYYTTQMKNPMHKKVKPNQREWILRLLALKTQTD